MKRACTLCGSTHYKTYSFKGGYVCEDCMLYLKKQNQIKEQVRIYHQY